jgi:formylglycine-generating enzyme required for sulfatase activity
MRAHVFALGFFGLALFVPNGCSAEGVEYEPGGWDRDASLMQPAQPAPVEVAVPILPQPVVEPVEERPVEPSVPAACPSDMVLAEGKHCTKVNQACKEWIEDPVVNPYARCRVFVEPTECKGERVPMRFCIDRLEMGGDDGLPLADKSWTEAKKLCESKGKRLCQEREWLFACEGEEAKPYPYGFVRNSDICNFERTEGLVTRKGDLADHRQPVTANPACVSPFGVQNMVGNIDEWVVLDVPHFSAKNNHRKMSSGLKGGWWGPLRNRCRPTTVDHDEVFHELQTGVRCCKNAD